MNALPMACGAVAVVGTLALGGVIAQQVQPELANAPAGMTSAEQERVDQAASASLFGQFRSSMADFLWLKVDKYLHRGVDLRGLTPLEREQQNADRVSSNAKDGYKEHAGTETTVVPSAARDWRGPYGNLERQIQPYHDMNGHSHADPKEALPLFRLMTLSNPHFVPGYVNGASMIAQNPGHYPEALAFLKEGEQNNPTSIEIESALGAFYTYNLKNLDPAIPYLKRAIALGAARDLSAMSEDESDAYEAAYRWYVLNRRDAHDQVEARRMALEGQKIFPLDVVCRNYLSSH